MPTAIKAAFTTPLSLSLDHSHSEVPQELQYMPPGTHRINASRAGKPVALDITVDATTAETLNAFLQAQLTKATEGNDDRPFFDFNHEDREAAAWPTEFYWAGDDLKTGGVRAKIEWSGAGQTAVKEKTFRRFSPTFIPDDNGKVISSETNMGGLVNRAAFKKIQPLFAKSEHTSETIHEARERGDGPRERVGPEGVTEAGAPRALKEQPLFAKGAPGSPISESATSTSGLPLQVANLPTFPLTSMKIQAKLHALKIIDSVEASEESIVQAIEAKFSQLETENRELKNRIEDAIQARAESLVDTAVNAGRIASNDADAKAFWTESLLRNEAMAVKALEALPVNPVLAKVTDGDDPKNGLLDKMQLQQKKLAEVHAANPQADFQTIFSKAQTDAPDLFR
jgi:phage I-like protein